jgi:hypothetical protein
MSNIKTALSRGIRAAKKAMGPQKYLAAGKRIVCPHCGCDLFNTVGLPYLLGHIMECSRCTLRLIFGDKPELD